MDKWRILKITKERNRVCTYAFVFSASVNAKIEYRDLRLCDSVQFVFVHPGAGYLK